MGLIKDIYSRDFYNRFADSMEKVLPAFNRKRFIDSIFTKEFKSMEWKQRMKHTTSALHKFMPVSFADSVVVIKKAITQLRKEGFKDGMLEFIFFPDYVETYGLHDIENSVKALEFITQFISCEFAIRPFILKYHDQIMQQMLSWSQHENHHVRRLASEGSRPRLPWGQAIPALKKDPTDILPILENLKNDPSEYVRRSVANNLNDLAKDNPDVVLRIAAKWKGLSKETDAIIKHGCRTLLKNAHPEIMKHYGLSNKKIDLLGFKLHTPVVTIGKHLEFAFTIINKEKTAQNIRLEYAVYYLRGKGQHSRKVFKISERIYEPREQVNIIRKQSFKIITTRRYYSGAHKIALIINGQEKAVADFNLIDN
jgi:3-methyladenine DNA glycosylase AlkC